MIFKDMPDFRHVINIRKKWVMTAVGQRVRDVRTALGWSQEELAQKADVPISQIGRIERGEVNTTISTLQTLAEALEVRMTELVDVS